MSITAAARPAPGIPGIRRAVTALIGSALIAGTVGGAVALGHTLENSTPGVHQVGIWGPAHNVAWSFDNKNRKNKRGPTVHHGLW